MFPFSNSVHLRRPFQPELVSHVVDNARLIHINLVLARARVRMALSLVRLHKVGRPLIDFPVEL